MNYRYLGRTGLPLSELSLGSWRTFGESISEELADQLMTLAYDAGVNFFDNAEAYAAGESERVMGRILKAKGWRRDSWCVSSKVFGAATSQLAKVFSVSTLSKPAIRRLSVCRWTISTCIFVIDPI